MASVTTKPKLTQLETPLTSTFPSELSGPSALSARSPLPGYADFIKQEEFIKTPITPPAAYTDFLKGMNSPAMGDKSGRTTPTSAPSTSSSDHSDCSCACETHKSPTTTTPSNFTFPTSAPPTGRLGRLRIPPSPAFSPTTESPRSATLRSPFSARSARSPYDWDLKSAKGRYFDVKSPGKAPRSNVRQVREIVTRTVTYTHTPVMSPAPKGKRRKVE
jgi:hypothetical protein